MMLPSVAELIRQRRAELFLGVVMLFNVALLIWLRLDSGQLAAQQDLVASLQGQAQASVGRIGVLRQQVAEEEGRRADVSSAFFKPTNPSVLQEHVVQAAGAN